MIYLFHHQIVWKLNASQENRQEEEATESDFKKTGKDTRRYFDFYYKVKPWKYEQCVVAKVEVNAQGTNIRFVVTSNHNNKQETVYRRYFGRSLMELWIKDMSSFGRIACHVTGRSPVNSNYFFMPQSTR